MHDLLKLTPNAVLSNVTYLFRFISEPIHPAFLPIPLIPFIHATRISLGYQNLRSKLGGGQISWTADLIGYLIMAWGGSLMTNLILYQPMPQLVSFRPFIIYTSIHWILKSIGFCPSSASLDRLLPLPDALIRISTISAAVDSVVNHREPAYATSLFLQLVIGAIAASGGSAMAQALGTTRSTWHWAKPDWIESPSALGALDVWSGVLVATVYGFFTQTHTTYQSLSEWLIGTKEPILDPLVARGACTILLALIYAWRANQTHRKIPERITNITKSKKIE